MRLLLGRLDSALSEDLREIIYGRRDIRQDLRVRLAWAMKRICMGDEILDVILDEI
jgi:hypothetical protein